ncbi:hypothetical protein BJ508DRAFT_341726 [Ascobolus immersus RN42]|uniref:Uncharacterized protein n=1 Tax=Ascobolus immersus RN42 TaxID=1160509 RepID=A0A3N4HGH2_ASCIM|nr:hypothetical protein BJ508DRAFT_341726 [Ascobolus immersus RN42]
MSTSAPQNTNKHWQTFDMLKSNPTPITPFFEFAQPSAQIQSVPLPFTLWTTDRFRNFTEEEFSLLLSLLGPMEMSYPFTSVFHLPAGGPWTCAGMVLTTQELENVHPMHSRGVTFGGRRTGDPLASFEGDIWELQVEILRYCMAMIEKEGREAVGLAVEFVGSGLLVEFPEKIPEDYRSLPESFGGWPVFYRVGVAEKPVSGSVDSKSEGILAPFGEVVGFRDVPLWSHVDCWVNQFVVVSQRTRIEGVQGAKVELSRCFGVFGGDGEALGDSVCGTPCVLTRGDTDCFVGYFCEKSVANPAIGYVESARLLQDFGRM